METIDRRSILEATPGLLALLFLVVSGGVDPDGIGAWVRGERPNQPSAARPRARPAPGTTSVSQRPPVPVDLRAKEQVPGTVRNTVTPTPSAVPSRRIDLNRATKRELERLPGIGPVKAAAMYAARNSQGGRFASWEDVERVPGIGPKTLEMIRREASL